MIEDIQLNSMYKLNEDEIQRLQAIVYAFEKEEKEESNLSYLSYDFCVNNVNYRKALLVIQEQLKIGKLPN